MTGEEEERKYRIEFTNTSNRNHDDMELLHLVLPLLVLEALDAAYGACCKPRPPLGDDVAAPAPRAQGHLDVALKVAWLVLVNRHRRHAVTPRHRRSLDGPLPGPRRSADELVDVVLAAAHLRAVEAAALGARHRDYRRPALGPAGASGHAVHVQVPGT